MFGAQCGPSFNAYTHMSECNVQSVRMCCTAAVQSINSS
jgi:hypothetical protein